MLAIGRALMSRPRVLLLDEPSLGLAPLVVAQIMRLLRTLTQQEQLTVLLVEQNARTALSIADHALVLYLGQVVLADDAQRVVERSRPHAPLPGLLMRPDPVRRAADPRSRITRC